LGEEPDVAAVLVVFLVGSGAKTTNLSRRVSVGTCSKYCRSRTTPSQAITKK
jgi:hypothetical protein